MTKLRKLTIKLKTTIGNTANHLKIEVFVWDISRCTIQKSLKQQFNPEFLNRIDDIILFNTLDKDVMSKIIQIELDKLVNRLKEKNYNISFDETIISRIAELNTQEDYGARPIKRIIQNLCEDFLSDEILKGTIKEKGKIILKMKDGEIKIFKK
jgi:ATP-dependent Clp protease ATP-binding subunit ClpC